MTNERRNKGKEEISRRRNNKTGDTERGRKRGLGEKDKASFFSPIQIADGEKIVAAAVAALAREDPHLVDREQRRRQQKKARSK